MTDKGKYMQTALLKVSYDCFVFPVTLLPVANWH